MGTERFPFDRLIRAVDELRDALRGESVFMQTGWSTYTPSYEHERFLSFRGFREKIHEARIVVSHAGVGTLLLCADSGKIPIMMARKQSFGEHVDDHQAMLVQRIVKEGIIIEARDAEAVRENILGYNALCESVVVKSLRKPALADDLKVLLDKISSGSTT